MTRSMSFHEPRTVDEAVALLAGDADARCLAGGATLVAMMNARLVEPSALVSLRHIEGLAGIEALADGTLRIGAMTLHRQTADDARLAAGRAVVREAAAVIASPPVRNMGTIGGSIAFGDPAADYPPALVAAGAEIEIVGPGGARKVTAGDFFTDWYETALAPGEIVVAVRVPPPPEDSASVYEKLARVEDDFAMVSVAVVLAMDGGACRHLRVAIGGCGPTPVHAAEAEERLIGGALDDEALRTLGEALAGASDPVDDVRASAEYRRMVMPRLVARTVKAARARLEAAS